MKDPPVAARFIKAVEYPAFSDGVVVKLDDAFAGEKVIDILKQNYPTGKLLMVGSFYPEEYWSYQLSVNPDVVVCYTPHGSTLYIRFCNWNREETGRFLDGLKRLFHQNGIELEHIEEQSIQGSMIFG